MRFLLLSLFYFGFTVFNSWGHPLGNFSLNHYNVIEIHPGGVVTQHILDFAEIPSFNELKNLDLDGDNSVSSEEMERYRSSLLERFLPNYLFSTIDNDKQVPLTPELLRNKVILARGEGSLTCIQIQLAFRFDSEILAQTGTHQFAFEDNNLTHMRGVREIRIKNHPGVEVQPSDISSSGPAIPIPLADNLYILSGLDTTIRYSVTQTRDMNDIQLTDTMTMINAASIPQFPLEKEPDGSYKILKSPIQPDQEVQAKISMLQPRNVVNATAALMGQTQATPSRTLPVNPEAVKVGEDSAYTRSQTDSEWADLIGAEELNFSFVVLALIFSVFFGAVHALSPGHGKTVVAAYLVGSRGTIYHAVFLGIVVTLTHVSSVFLIGLVTLYLSEYIVPDKLYPIIEGASGLLIMGIGISLFLRRYGAYQRIKYAESMGIRIDDHAHHHHDHPHDHHHDHAEVHSHNHEHPHTHHRHDHESDHSHPHHHHDHESDHSHPHEHSHHDHEHEHPHSHGGWMDHEHGPGTHTHEIPADATFKDLLLLGITGGIVPCPSAIVVLLVAIAMRRILFGMAMIVFFSIGLAAVLITIGILMVTAKRFLDHFQTKESSLQWLQIVSPVLVTLIGIAIFIRGLQTAGIVSIQF